MKYKGIELKRFYSDKPVTFDPPKKMVVWNSIEGESSLTIDEVIAYIPERDFYGHKSVICKLNLYGNCAELPEEPKPRKTTNRELSKWLVEGNGEVLTNVILPNGKPREAPTTNWHYFSGSEDEVVDYGSERQRCKGVRKWNDTDWHEPTADYMGLVDHAMPINHEMMHVQSLNDVVTLKARIEELEKENRKLQDICERRTRTAMMWKRKYVELLK